MMLEGEVIVVVKLLGMWEVKEFRLLVEGSVFIGIKTFYS